MKIRKGFVTNSSSSSFVCQLCGVTETGWDLGAEEAGFVVCENDHEFCLKHLINIPDNMEKREFAYESDFSCYEIPSENCPICQLQSLTNDDYIKYLAKKDLTKQVILTEIREKFGDYNSLKEFLSENQ